MARRPTDVASDVRLDRLLMTRPILRFVLVVIALYGAWFTAYTLWIGPDGRLDEALSLATASATGALLDMVADPVTVDGRIVAYRESAIRVVDECNGLSSLVLFVGFVLAYPGTWARRALFIPMGLLAIAFVNVVRCAGLLVALDHSLGLFRRLHTEHTTLVFHAIIFGLWVLWSRVGDPEPQRVAG